MVVEGLVRPYIVEVGPELVEASLLSGSVTGRRDGGIGLERDLTP